MEQNIIIERHYLTPQMYREMYLGYPNYTTNRYSQSFYTYPYANNYIHPILASSYNQPFSSYTYPTYQQMPHTAINPVSHPPQPPQPPQPSQPPQLPHPPQPPQPPQLPQPPQPPQPPQLLQPTSTEQTNMHSATAQATAQAPPEIRNLINNLINNNTPFQLEISTLPISRILNQFRNAMNDNNNADNDTNTSVNLANINSISSVKVFSSIASNIQSNASNTSIEMCSVCQTDFEGTDIVRRLNNCGHLFHLNCVDRWLSNHDTCPTCRHNLTDDINENTSDEDEDEDEDEASQDDNISECNECDSECECNCHEDENDSECECDMSDCEINNTENTSNSNGNSNIVSTNENDDREGFSNYFILTNSRNSSNNSNTLQATSQPQQATSQELRGSFNTASTARTTSEIPNIVLNEFQSDINHFITLGTPLINNLLRTTNTAAQLNSTNINGNVNNMLATIHPLLTVFGSIIQQDNRSN